MLEEENKRKEEIFHRITICAIYNHSRLLYSFLPKNDISKLNGWEDLDRYTQIKSSELFVPTATL